MKSENWMGFIYEHIVIAEENLGRYLMEGEVVHHLNGIRDDNRHCNLLVLFKSQHGRLHAWLNAGAPGVERLRENGKNSVNANDVSQKYCSVCNVTLQDKQKNTCSIECMSMFNRQVERPSKEQLSTDIHAMSLVKVGKKYNVSDNAIRKWMRAYGISKPILSRAVVTTTEGAETSGEVQSS